MKLIFDFESMKNSSTVSGDLMQRALIDEKYTWNLKDIFSSEDVWESEFKWVEENLDNYKKFEGKLSSSAAVLLECLVFDDKIGSRLSRISNYASMAKDIDLADAKYQAMYDRVSILSSKASAASSFIRPELIALSEELINRFIDEEDGLKLYKHQFEDLFRKKAHTLSRGEEELLAHSAPLVELAYTAFGYFTNADIQFPSVVDDKGNNIQMSHGRFYAALESSDRGYRQRAYKAFYKPYNDYKNTLNSLFNGNIKSLSFNAKARKYKSTKHASLDSNNVPVSVYDNLIKTINENLASLHRWGMLKKKVLGLDELHPYDTYVTLFPKVKKEYSYEEGKEVVLSALEPLGKDYNESLLKAFNNRWIDVYETKGKRNGAYSSNTIIGVHPYVLLNWNNQLNDVFTLAHEMGHNMHSYYTETNQPYPYADYSIFVAEVASTANEALLQEYLIEKAESKEMKLALIENYLNNITTTFYRQTRFAEFEELVHAKVENGESLTPDELCSLTGNLYKKYWGESIVVDEEETYTWARIPHFYYNFYVYQYATGFAASQILVEKIKKEGQPAIDKYLSFLKAGSSDYPINVLAKAGVDMNSPEPVLAVVHKMNYLLDEMENLLDG